MWVSSDQVESGRHPQNEKVKQSHNTPMEAQGGEEV
jgi:hypothetical protein